MVESHDRLRTPDHLRAEPHALGRAPGGDEAAAQAADAAGLNYLAIQDHAYNIEFLDVWTLISYLAAETDRISFVPDVADLQLRPPAMLAKAAASLPGGTADGERTA